MFFLKLVLVNNDCTNTFTAKHEDQETCEDILIGQACRAGWTFMSSWYGMIKTDVDAQADYEYYQYQPQYPDGDDS